MVKQGVERQLLPGGADCGVPERGFCGVPEVVSSDVDGFAGHQVGLEGLLCWVGFVRMSDCFAPEEVRVATQRCVGRGIGGQSQANPLVEELQQGPVAGFVVPRARNGQ